MPVRNSTVANVAEFMRTARERFDFGMAADMTDRLAAMEDVEFVAGDQWEKEAYERRRKFHRPALTWNRLHIYVAQVVNAGRQNDRSIKIAPGDGGSKETSEYLQSRIRQIEYESNSDQCQNKAREQQVTSGRGFYRITTSYKFGTFQQQIRFEPIPNQFSVVWDPTFAKYDSSDADWCFVISYVTKDGHKRKFGKESEAARSNYFTGMGNPAPAWMNVGTGNDLVQIADYYERTWKGESLYELSDGRAVFEKDIEGRDRVLIQNEREEMIPTVRLYTIDGVEIHDETELLSDDIPVIPYWGVDEIVNGQKRTRGLVRFAKGPQRLVNLYVSNIAEQVGQIPKSPYVAAEGQLANHEEEWENANVDPRAVLQYVAISIGGHLAPAPQRIVSEPPIQALTIGLTQAIDGVKAAMGMFDASIGARSNETSGLAIQRRDKQADNANYHFSGNEDCSRKHAGRIILQMIRKIETNGIFTTRSSDGKTKKVLVGQPHIDQETGNKVHHQIDQGDYDCIVESGPSYNSQRQEAFGTYSAMAQAYPPLMQVAGDIIMRNLDAPGADVIADRLEKTLPPEMQPQKEGGPPPIPPEVQQKLQQGQQVIQALTAQLHKAEDDAAAHKPEIDARIQIAQMQEDTKRMQIQLEREIAKVSEGLKADMNHMKAHLETVRDIRDFAAAAKQQDADNAARDRDAEQAQAAQEAEAEAQPVGAGS